MKEKIRAFVLELNANINFRSLLPKIGATLGWVLLLTFVVNVAVLLHDTVTTKGIVYSKDNDAGRGIQTATITRWYNSNHFAPYGNLYFRLAHTIAKLSPSYVDAKTSAPEKLEKEHHFALMLTSLLSLVGFCLFLSWVVNPEWIFVPWMTNVLLHLAVLDPTWVQFLFRVHPDHLLMAMVLVSSFFTMIYARDNSRKNFVIAGLLWGIATAVKRSTILFIPSFIFLFLSRGLKKENFVQGVQFAGYMLLSYLLIGFPQNFGFYKHIHFMYIETYNSAPASWYSITNYLELVFEQSKFLVCALVPLQIFFGHKEQFFNWRYLGFTVIAFIILLSGSMANSHDHHVMPHVAVMLILIVSLLRLIPAVNIRLRYLVFIMACCVFFFLKGDVYGSLITRYEHETACLSDSENVLSLVGKIQDESNAFLVRDPYFPFDSSHKDLTIQIWGVSGTVLEEQKATLWGTKRNFIEAIIHKAYRPHIYPGMSREAWDEKILWNTNALSKSQMMSPQGKIFEKIYEDKCGFMVWKRKE